MSASVVFDELGAVLSRWTVGGPAAGEAPGAWKSVVSFGPDAELRLLALSSQFVGCMAMPVPPSDARRLADLPLLRMPTLPTPLRPLARRCLKAFREPGQQRNLAHMVAARGYALHPADWIPSRNEDDLPEVYAPLLDWAAGSSDAYARAASITDVLTEDNWSDFAPAARLAALASLRRSDPHRARMLLEARFGGESAEVRARLIALLAVGVSDADISFLQTLMNDRAPKVKATALSLLARLGHGYSGDEDARELAAFLEVQTKGILRRSRVISPIALKTPAQRARRDELLGRVDFNALAAALSMDGETLAGLWPLGADASLDTRLAAMAARSAGDGVIAALADRLAKAETLEVQPILALRPRFGPDERARFAYRLAATQGGGFRGGLMIYTPGVGIDGLIDTFAGAALMAALAAHTDVTFEIQALGLLASNSAAREAIQRLTSAGLLASDPRLDLLRLNAALTAPGASS